MYYVYHIKRKEQTLDEGYIGVSTAYKTRWTHHRHHLKAGTHSNPHLQNAWNKYSDIEYVLLHTCDTEKEMLDLEIKYRPTPDIGWNCKSGGFGKFTQSDNTKEKIRNYNTGRKHSEESKLKMSEAKKGIPTGRKGIKHTEASKLKMQKAKLGKLLPEAHKLKIGKSLEKYTEPKMWLHLTELYFYGTPIELWRAYPYSNLAKSALYKVYNEKYQQHKSWVLLE